MADGKLSLGVSEDSVIEELLAEFRAMRRDDPEMLEAVLHVMRLQNNRAAARGCPMVEKKSN